MNNPINRVGQKGLSPVQQSLREKTEPKDESFGKILKGFVDEVNTLQHSADESIEKLATGEITDVHQVMIAVEEANTAMEFMLEIRNKIVDAYQEIMRMPV
ncbi:flagellar hook-basal body complex protein FliE [Candidatus Latescibacterota bacterium]